MNLQSVQISLPNVNYRHMAGHQAAEAVPRRAPCVDPKQLCCDSLQSWVRAGHGLAMLLGVDHPGRPSPMTSLCCAP